MFKRRDRNKDRWKVKTGGNGKKSLKKILIIGKKPYGNENKKFTIYLKNCELQLYEIAVYY